MGRDRRRLAEIRADAKLSDLASYEQERRFERRISAGCSICLHIISGCIFAAMHQPVILPFSRRTFANPLSVAINRSGVVSRAGLTPPHETGNVIRPDRLDALDGEDADRRPQCAASAHRGLGPAPEGKRYSARLDAIEKPALEQRIISMCWRDRPQMSRTTAPDGR